MEYKLASGRVVTDEDMEREARMWEDDTWEGGFTDIRIGRPRLAEEELGTVVFKAPLSRIAAMEQKAKEQGVSKSEFMRDAMEKAIA